MHENLLSKGLLEFVKQNKFHGFYGCTHRCYSTLTDLKTRWTNGLISGTPEYERVINNYTTVSVTINFGKATGLNCLGVSTLDDLSVNRLGYGYNELIEPFETGQMQPFDNFGTEFVKNYDTKNPQLLQIAKHAHEINQAAQIDLYYIDDNLRLCEGVSSITSCPDWPQQVNINVYQHEAIKGDDAPVGLLGKYGIFSTNKNSINVKEEMPNHAIPFKVGFL